MRTLRWRLPLRVYSHVQTVMIFVHYASLLRLDLRHSNHYYSSRMAPNHRRPGNCAHKRSRRSSAVNARWQKCKVLECLSTGIANILEHKSKCMGKCSIKEASREGLASVLEVACNACDAKSLIETSTKIPGSSCMKARYSVNVGAVWGQMATGGGQRALSEHLASFNVPCMSKNTFLQT